MAVRRFAGAGDGQRTAGGGGFGCPGDDCQVISVYHQFDCRGQTFEFTSGFSVPDSSDSVPAGFSSWSIPEKRALRVEHVGSYDHLGNAWSAANQYARYKKLKLGKDCGYEIYVSDPETTPTAELRTEVVLPLK